MTLDQFQRAQLAAFAFRQAGETGSIQSMKAVCYVLANRIKWHDGGWMDVIEHAPDTAAHESLCDECTPLSLRNPALQGLLREIDEIYSGFAQDETREVVGKCCYWQVLTRRDVRPWFQEHIIRDPKSHPRRAHVGTIVLYE